MGLKWMVFVAVAVTAASVLALEPEEGDYNDYEYFYDSDQDDTEDIDIENHKEIDKLMEQVDSEMSQDGNKENMDINNERKKDIDTAAEELNKEKPDSNSEENVLEQHDVDIGVRDSGDVSQVESDNNLKEQDTKAISSGKNDFEKLPSNDEEQLNVDLNSGENNQPLVDNNSDEVIKEEIKQFMGELDEPESDSDDIFDDYQVEDNRSDRKLGEIEKTFELPTDNDGSFESIYDADDAFFVSDEMSEISEESNDEDSPDIDQVVEDAKRILEENNDTFEEDIEIPQVNQDTDLVSAESEAYDDDNKEEILEHINGNQQKKDTENNIKELTKSNEENLENKASNEENVANAEKDNNDSKDFQILKVNVNLSQNEEDNDDSDDDANENDSNVPEEKKMSEEGDEDTVDKAYQDLNADLKKLFETWDKLTNDDTKEDIGVLEYEEKYGKPFGESEVLAQRDEQYDNYDNDESDLDISEESTLRKGNNAENEDDTDVIVEKKQDNAQNPSIDTIQSNAPNNISETKDVPNQNNKLENEKNDETELKEVVLPIEESVATSTVKTIDVHDLTPEQYNDLMTQFTISHKSELNDDSRSDSAPIHLTLSTEEVTEITSPNYPNFFPTNNVIEWILEGNGTGIELNITDLVLRGAQDDYLLIKPGASKFADDGQGLLFSFELTQPRMYHFTEVNKVYIRFNAGAGWAGSKGFRLSIKLIWPPETHDEKDLPEPEPLLPKPPAIMKVNLGGIRFPHFAEIKEDFRRIIADMATMYIIANEIERGVNSTSEVAQITNVVTCNVNWPNFVDCVEVAFGVPLVYEDEPMTRLNYTDLRTMWETYVSRDPFAARLRAMGIMEFAVPNDSRVMMAWVILAVGIVISAALLALSLWRYSCFEDYTRMKTFSDTDSLRDEKRGLDLYPTPHQTLPPLYGDVDYKWADANNDDSTRVDVGGFTNNSFARDELFDIDSDEDVAPKRDRKASFSPRDVYQV